jgi:glucose-1-phosphate adenylyltransferase
MTKNVISLILGGGAGSRLYPLTAERSKPAVPIAGKYRLIDIPISNCLNSKITRMYVLTQFNSTSLNRHIKNTYHFDIFNKGFVDIFAAQQTRSQQDWFLGTADAARRVIPHMDNYDYEYALILSGDQLYQMDFSEFVKYHIEKKADLSIATIPVVSKDAPGFGIMKVDGEGKIRKFIEKPSIDILPEWESDVPSSYRDQGKIFLASMGIYLFNKDVLKELLKKNPEQHDFGKGIIPYAIENNYRVSSFSFDKYWTDIGSISSFFEANLELADPLPQFNLFDNEDIVYTRARMLSPTKIFGTVCKGALISEGCIIHAAEISRSVIGIRARIGPGTVIVNSYSMGQDYYQDIDELKQQGLIPWGIGSNCYIEKAIIDRNVCIGDGVVIKGGEGLEDYERDEYVIRDEIVVIRKNAIIPDGSKIGLA